MEIVLSLSNWTAHYNQILYSLMYYSEKNKVKIKIKHLPHLPSNGVQVKIGDKISLLDYSDDVKFIENPQKYHCYFKRSLLPEDKIMKVYPLNFNLQFGYKPYKLLKKMPFSLLANKRSKTETGRALDYFCFLTKNSHHAMDINGRGFQNNIQDNNGRILFMSRLWDPDRNNDPEEKERRRQQNDFRINACRLIKKNFPNSIAGLYPDYFAERVAADVLLDLKTVKKVNYLKEVAKADIAVVDDGLKDTPGWRIGEYTMWGKAIISTPIRTVVEGFKPGVQYMSTRDRNNYEALPDIINDLLKGKKYMDFRENTEKWYNTYLRPDQYIERIISKIEMENTPSESNHHLKNMGNKKSQIAS